MSIAKYKSIFLGKESYLLDQRRGGEKKKKRALWSSFFFYYFGASNTPIVEAKWGAVCNLKLGPQGDLINSRSPWHHDIIKLKIGDLQKGLFVSLMGNQNLDNGQI